MNLRSAEVDKASEEREAKLAELNAKLPAGQRWRRYWDKETHVASVRDAWVVGLIRLSSVDSGRGMFVCTVDPIGDGRFHWSLPYSKGSGSAENIDAACKAGRAAAIAADLIPAVGS